MVINKLRSHRRPIKIGTAPVFLSLLALLMTSSISAQSEWAKKSVDLSRGPEAGRLVIASPNLLYSVVIDGLSLSVEKEGRKLPGIESEGVGLSLAELMWSPDSKAFCITESLGGWVGEWAVKLFRIINGRVEVADISREAIKDFMKSYKCMDLEEPNVGAISWIESSTKILLALEVPPHSSCPEMGMKRGYLVEIPSGRILKQIDWEVLEEKYKSSLGTRLSDLHQ